MSRNGYENYSVGPFDAFYSRLQRSEHEPHQRQNTQMSSLSGRDLRVSASQPSSAITHPESQALKTELEQLLSEEKVCEHGIEEACDALQEKKRLIDEQRKRLEKQQKALEELCHYGQTMEQKLTSLRQQIIAVRQKMAMVTEKDSSNRLFTSQSRGSKVHGRQAHGGQTRPLASVLSPNYAPQANAIEALAQFHHIPTEFIQKKLIEFRIHYTETQEQRTGWDRSFYNWVVNGWKREKHNKMIDRDFCPEPELLKALQPEGISPEFCEKECQGFILYWREQQATFTPKLWQERFKQWVLRAWRRQKTDEGRARSSRPTTEEFANASRSDRFHFDFDKDD